MTRLAVLADIHGNKPALDAVIADLARRQVDAVVNLGDCVSGPLWPAETLRLLRHSGWPTVRGNHDRVVGANPPDSLGPSDRFAFDALTAGERVWLASLPTALRFDGGIVAFHARPDHDDSYLLEDWNEGRLIEAGPDRVADRLGSLAEARLVLTAHSHRPGLMRLRGGMRVVNPGSVGCPAYYYDGTNPPHVSEAGSPDARYAVVEWGDKGFMFEFYAIPYDHEAAASRAEANGRPDWAVALRTGFTSLQGLRSGGDDR